LGISPWCGGGMRIKFFIEHVLGGGGGWGHSPKMGDDVNNGLKEREKN
jgi:hypothetical protein